MTRGWFTPDFYEQTPLTHLLRALPVLSFHQVELIDLFFVIRSYLNGAGSLLRVITTTSWPSLVQIHQIPSSTISARYTTAYTYHLKWHIIGKRLKIAAGNIMSFFGLGLDFCLVSHHH